MSDSNLKMQKYIELSKISMNNYVFEKKKENFICKDLLNPILISMNLSIKIHLLELWNLIPVYSKPKFILKLFQTCISNESGCMNFGKLNSHNLTMSEMNLKILRINF